MPRDRRSGDPEPFRKLPPRRPRALQQDGEELPRVGVPEVDEHLLFENRVLLPVLEVPRPSFDGGGGDHPELLQLPEVVPQGPPVNPEILSEGAEADARVGADVVVDRRPGLVFECGAFCDVPVAEEEPDVQEEQDIDDDQEFGGCVHEKTADQDLGRDLPPFDGYRVFGRPVGYVAGGRRDRVAAGGGRTGGKSEEKDNQEYGSRPASHATGIGARDLDLCVFSAAVPIRLQGY